MSNLKGATSEAEGALIMLALGLNNAVNFDTGVAWKECGFTR